MIEQTLISYGYPPRLDAQGEDLFCDAALHGFLPVVAAYLALGIDVNAGDGGRMALMKAVEKNNLPLIRCLIAAGADPEARDRDGDTALHTAANWKHLEALRLLDAYGACPNTVNQKGFSPLSQAVASGQRAVVEALLAMDADPNWLPDPDGGPGDAHFVPPLAHAARNGQTDLIALLLQAGADPGLRYGPDGRTCWLDALLNQQVEAAQQFLETGQSLDVASGLGWTPWMAALYQGQDEMAHALEAAGAAVGDRDRVRLLRAAREGDRHTVEACVSAGADIDTRDPDGATPLLLAVAQRHDALVHWLLTPHADRGLAPTADVTLRDREGRDGLTYAVEHENPELARALIAAGADPNAPATPPLLIRAVQQQSIPLTTLLLEAGADVNGQNEDEKGNTALHAAVKNNFPDLVALLLKAGADPNRPNVKGEAPLHWRLKKEYAPIYEALLAAGADPFLLDSRQWSPMSHADREIRQQIRDQHTWELYRAQLAAWGLDEDAAPPPEFFSELAQTSPAVAPALWVDQVDYSYDEEQERQVAEILRGLLQAGMSPDVRYDSSPPLYRAVSGSRDALVRVLLEAGADVNARGILNGTPLMTARKPGIARLLLEAGADVTLRRDANFTALKVAVEEDRPKIVDLLIEFGADVDEVPAGTTPLMIAASRGKLAAARRLLRHGAQLEIVDSIGQTALFRAVREHHIKLVTLLLEAGANPNIRVHQGYTPLMVAILDNRPEIAEKLLAAGADPLPALEDGRTAFDMAAGQPRILTKLQAAAQERTPPDLPPPERQPPQPELHRAALWGDIDALQALLAEGVGVDIDIDINAPNHRGDTPLLLAAAWGQHAALQMLLAAGADVAAANRAGETALTLALINGHDAIIQALRAAGATFDPHELLALLQRRLAFDATVRRGEIEAAREMVSRGEIDVDGPLSDGRTPLLTAVARHDERMIRSLLDVGADPDRSRPGCPAPLVWAVQEGDVALVNLLLRLGVDTQAVDARGATALHLAARAGYADVVDSLLLAEADVNAPSRQGATPLHACLLPLLDPDRPAGSTRTEARAAIVESLLEFGADPNHADEEGHTPLALAQAAGLKAAAQALRQAGAIDGPALPTSEPEPISLIPLHAASEAAGGPLLHALKCRSAEVVAYSPDGRYLAVGQIAGVTLWETATWMACCKLSHTGEVHDLAWRSDGAVLAVAGAAADASMRRLVARMVDDALAQARAQGQIDPAQEAEIRADLEHSQRQTERSGVYLWDAAAAIAAGGRHDTPLRALPAHESGARAVAYSPDDRRLVSGGQDGAVHLWDAESGERLRTLKKNGPAVRALAWSMDGQRVMVAGFNGLLEAWDVEAGTRLYACPGGESGGLHGSDDGDLHGLALSPDGRQFATCANNRSVRLWRLHDGEAGAVNQDHEYGVVSVAWHPSRHLIASGGTDHTVRVWNGGWLSGSRVLKGHRGHVNSVAWHPGGRQLASAASDGTVRIWDPFRPKQPAPQRPRHRDRVLALAWSPDGRFVVSGGGYKDETLKVWDGASGDLLRTLKGHNTPIDAVCFSPGGDLLACGAKLSYEGGQRVTLWDTTDWHVIGTANYKSEYMYDVESVAFSPDGQLVAGGSSDCLVFVWRTASRRLKHVLTGHKQYYAIRVQVAFTPDGQTLITGGSDGLIKFWDVESGQELATLPKGRNISALAVSPDGTRLLVGNGGELELWDTQKRTEMDKWRAWYEIDDLAWLPDGRHAVIVGSEKVREHSLLVWDTVAGERVAECPSEAPLYACAVAPDGRGVVVGDADGRVVFFRLRGL